MKNLFYALVITFLFNTQAMAYIYCKSESKTQGQPTFQINVFESNIIQALVVDLRKSRLPNSYICSKTELEDDGETYTQYTCQGGSLFGEEEQIGLFVLESHNVANYYASQEEFDLKDLKCNRQ